MSAEEARKLLAGLRELQVMTARAGARIRDGAVARRGVVDSRLEELRPAGIGDAAAGAEYQALVEERGRLDRVIGSASARS